MRRPPFFDDLPAEPGPLAGIEGARVLALLGDSVTADQRAADQDAASLGLTGDESYAVRGLAEAAEVPRTVTVTAPGPPGPARQRFS